MSGYEIGRFAELLGRLEFTFGRDYLGAALTLGFGFLSHGSLHIVGQSYILDLHRRDLRAPRLGMLVDDILDLHIYLAGLRQELVEGESSHHIPHGGLADLIDGIIDVLDGYDRLLGIDDVIIGHGGDVDGDIVLGDDLLRRDIHGDGAQSDLGHALEYGYEDDEARAAHTGAFAQEEDDATVVFFDDL